LLAAAGVASAQSAQPAAKRRAPEWYEWRQYKLRIGAMPKQVNDFLGQTLLPALQRLGVGPVGAFETAVGPEMPTVHLLIPHESPATLGTLPARLAADAAYNKGLAAFEAAAATQPPFVRVESALLAAFEKMPRLEPPGTSKPRVFELRVYESPTEGASQRKADMFMKMGELEIFRRCGLTPVFFGKTVVGARQPGFVYLLTFPDMAAREKAWAAFRADPEWLKLKVTPGYTDAEIMSNITDVLMRPTGYSLV
jgi:hypothetical protein